MLIFLRTWLRNIRSSIFLLVFETMISQKKSHTIWWKKCQLSSSLFYSTSSTLFHEAGLSRVTSVAEDRHVILLLLVRPSRGQHAAEMSTTYPCLCSARKWYNMWLLLAVMMWYVYNFHCEFDCVIIPIFHFEKSTVISNSESDIYYFLCL